LINLDSDGNYKWGRHIQCPGIEFGQAVAVDDEGGIYIGVEHSNPVDFDPEDGVGEVECTDVDCFSITKYSKDGEYLWTRTVTSNHTLHIEDLVSTQEAILGTGTLIGLADFDPGPDVDMHGRNSGADIYITKLGLDGSYEWTTSIGRPGDIYRPSISINLDDYIYITAYFSNTVDFDPSECRDERTAGVDDPNMNAFLWKVSWDGKYYP